MESQVFGAGTIPGSPTTANEIKTLLCLLLCELEEQVSFEQLNEILTEGRMVNYFDLVQNLDQLVESGHISRREIEQTEFYTVEELGKKTARALYTSLPKSVRDRTIESGQRVLARHRRLQEVTAEIVQAEDGFQVTLGIPDHGTDLIALTVFAPTRTEAESIRRRFLNHPVFIYKSILALLHGDRSFLGELPTGQEPLF